MFKDIIGGKFIYLKRITEDDAPDVFKWRSSKSGELLHQPDGYSVEMQRSWINSRPDSEINYIIYDTLFNVKVGMISICEVNHMDKIAECGRLILDYKYIEQGSPYGLEALVLCYGYIFDVMGFRKTTGTINARNDNVISLQSYLGMTQEGRLKKHTLTQGKHEDLLIFSMFSEDFPYYKSQVNKLLQKYK